jgi:hypothetical protein
MKCCRCNQELDVSKNEIPPKWFGIFTICDLKKVICAECIKKPENKEWGTVGFE